MKQRELRYSRGKIVTSKSGKQFLVSKIISPDECFAYPVLENGTIRYRNEVLIHQLDFGVTV